MKLHLGAGKDARAGWVNLDQCALPGIDVVADLGKCKETPLPFADDTFEELFGSHVIEHIEDTLSLMQELHRISKDGAVMLLKCPYGSSDDAHENPTHVRQYFIHSFGYFSRPFFWRESYGYTGDWQPERIALLIKRDLAEGKDSDELFGDVMLKRNIVSEMHAYLKCVKPIREESRELIVHPKIELVLI